MTPEEEDGQQDQHHDLYDAIVGQQEGLQPSGEENADEVGVAMVAGYHVEHLLIKYEDVVEGGVECRQQQEECATEDGIAVVAPHLGVA